MVLLATFAAPAGSRTPHPSAARATFDGLGSILRQSRKLGMSRMSFRSAPIPDPAVLEPRLAPGLLRLAANSLERPESRR